MSIDAIPEMNRFVPLDAIEPPQPELLAVLHALADANRLRIFLLLRAGERCVCDIETSVHLPQNLVSHHLRVLREAGLIRSRRDGRWAYYAVDAVRLAALQPALGRLFDPTSVGADAAQC